MKCPTNKFGGEIRKKFLTAPMNNKWLEKVKVATVHCDLIISEMVKAR